MKIDSITSFKGIQARKQKNNRTAKTHQYPNLQKTRYINPLEDYSSASQIFRQNLGGK